MRLGLKLGIIGILTVISVLAGWYFHPKKVIYTEGFEEGFSGLEGDADVPQDPNNPGSLVDWKVSRVTSPVKFGQYSVELFIAGREDDGTVWIERELSMKKTHKFKLGFLLIFTVKARVSMR